MTSAIISDIKVNGRGFLLLFLFTILFPVNSYAHKVYVFAWAENGRVFTESKFSSHTFVKNGKIIVQDEKGTILLTGTTSDKGTFSFKIPEKLESYLMITLDATMGHKAEWKLDYDEILQAKMGKSSKKIAEKKEEKKIKHPSILNASAGILIIFIFFLLIAFYNKKIVNKKDDSKQ